MAVSVALEFIPPDEPDLLALHVYESPTSTGTFVEIDSTQTIGAYPNWITRYTTALATSIYDWFAIAWENTANVTGDLSAPLQGGSTTLVSEVVNRVLLRDPSLNHIIVGQEAETAISEYFNVADPYTIDLVTVTPREMSGLTYFTMARSYISRIVTTAVSGSNKWTSGLVSMDAGTGATKAAWDDIDRLLKAAGIELNRNYSVILLAEEIGVAGGYKISTGSLTTKILGVDLSRSIAMMTSAGDEAVTQMVGFSG